MISLTDGAKSGKLLSTEDGWIICPRCKRNKRLKRIYPGEEAERVGLYCRDCRRVIYVRIHRGQSFESQGQQ